MCPNPSRLTPDPEYAMSRVRKPAFRTALFAVPFLVAGTLGAGAAPAGAAQPTGTHPGDTSLTCRGKGVDPDALIRYRTGTVIHAPLRTVWKLQTDVARWPSWQSPVQTAHRLDHGPLRKGSAFRWTTPVPATPTTPATTLHVTSTVEQIRQGSCTRWTGPAIGEGLRIDNGVHVWNYTKVKGGVRVSTEETHTGAQVEGDVPTATAMLGAGLKGWLHDLKTAAEAHVHHPHA